MIILFFIIGVILLSAGIFIYTKHYDVFYRKDLEWVYITLNTVGTIIIAICIITSIATGVCLSERLIIDEKIEMYEAENSIIEREIATIVQEYKSYESDTFEKFKNSSPTVMVSVFPELKSDELVNQQITLHANNNAEIKKLKQQRLDYKLYAWWLYFGN